MKKLFWLAVVVIFSSFIANDDDKAIREVFSQYRTTLKNHNGDAAVRYVDKNTLAYYQRIADLLRTADSAVVSAQPIMDKMIILAIRFKASTQEIASFTGETIFVYSVNSELTEASGTENIELGTITIKSDSAQAQIVYQGKPVPLYFTFHKEDGLWKMDITSLIKITENIIKDALAKADLSEDEAVMKVLELMYDESVNNSLWYPKK